jgi:hypothetical protein
MRQSRGGVGIVSEPPLVDWRSSLIRAVAVPFPDIERPGWGQSSVPGLGYPPVSGAAGAYNRGKIAVGGRIPGSAPRSNRQGDDCVAALARKSRRGAASISHHAVRQDRPRGSVKPQVLMAVTQSFDAARPRIQKAAPAARPEPLSSTVNRRRCSSASHRAWAGEPDSTQC